MLTKETPIGNITISNDYFSKLIAHAVSSCYGVVGMVPTRRQKLYSLLRRPSPKEGVSVKGTMESIDVTLRLVLSYGVNIGAIADSIVNKVKFTVQEATGILVNKVTVLVDGVQGPGAAGQA